MYSLRKAARTRRARNFIAPDTLRQVAEANRAVLGIATGRGGKKQRLQDHALHPEPHRGLRPKSTANRSDQNGF
jgi:hypothetical protein